MPRVDIGLKAGRTVDQKRAMVREVTKAIAKTVDCPEDAVSITIYDIKPENIGIAGKLPYVD